MNLARIVYPTSLQGSLSIAEVHVPSRRESDLEHVIESLGHPGNAWVTHVVGDRDGRLHLLVQAEYRETHQNLLRFMCGLMGVRMVTMKPVLVVGKTANINNKVELGYPEIIYEGDTHG